MSPLAIFFSKFSTKVVVILTTLPLFEYLRNIWHNIFYKENFPLFEMVCWYFVVVKIQDSIVKNYWLSSYPLFSTIATRNPPNMLLLISQLPHLFQHPFTWQRVIFLGILSWSIFENFQCDHTDLNIIPVFCWSPNLSNLCQFF